jgi:hypothetical protein
LGRAFVEFSVTACPFVKGIVLSVVSNTAGEEVTIPNCVKVLLGSVGEGMTHWPFVHTWLAFARSTPSVGDPLLAALMQSIIVAPDGVPVPQLLPSVQVVPVMAKLVGGVKMLGPVG